MLKQIAAIPGPQAIKLSLLLLLALLVAGAVAGATLSLTRAQAANGVYDADGDKLIEISNLDQLNALRYDRDGDGAADRDIDAGEYALVFPVHSNESVCDSGCNGYELAKSLDFNQAASYRTGSVNTAWTDTTGEGWTPIVHRDNTETPKPYNAKFEGNGYTISNLYSNATGIDRETGLFARLGEDADVNGVGLLSVSITGGYYDAGGLAGRNLGDISNSYATGTLKGKGDIGGLVGNNAPGASITGSHSSGSVTGDENNVGGLAGDNFGALSRSYSSSTVSGKKDYVGGLTGYNAGSVNHSYASGAVSGKGECVGGLVGKNVSAVTAAFAYGAVSGSDDYVGGLVGNNIGTVTVSYAAGAVSGTGDYVGGLAGKNGGTVRNAYAMNDVSGNSSVGGLIGDNTATVKYAFAVGSVTGQASLGGLIGTMADSGTTVTGSYWDTTVGLPASTIGTGKTTTELQTPTGYTGIYANWQSGTEGDVWDFGTASRYPALKADMDGDGTATADEFGSQYSIAPDADAHADAGTDGYTHADAYTGAYGYAQSLRPRPRLRSNRPRPASPALAPARPTPPPRPRQHPP